MSFSDCAGTAILPTLSRIVLCAAFVSVGFNKLFDDVTFTSEEATILRDNYRVEVVPQTESEAPSEVTSIEPTSTGPVSIQPVSLQVTDIEETDPDPSLGSNTPVAEPPATPEEDETAPDETEPTPAAPALPGTQAGLHKVTLMLHNAGLPYADYGAWIVAWTEFIGGILLLLGFFSRIWGIGLAFAMGVAFYIVTMGINGMLTQTINPIEFSKNIGAFNTMFAQLGLGLLALGIFLAGPGPISLDRLFFGGQRGEKPVPVEE
ncbi:MAG: DoxX family membrane protein [Phycisphaerales bacterium]|nr:MAG: DoxX family membrane protein [Phycisphaerales bacterium]